VEALTVLMNAEAGHWRPSPEIALARTLADQGVPAVIEMVEPRRLEARVREMAGIPMLGVAGGDGTQRTAARTLTGSDTALVPFPTGRLNHFARRLGLDTVEAAAEAAREARTLAIPVGMVNDHVFVNTAVAGGYPWMVLTRERLRSFLTTWPAAAVASVAAFVRWRRIDATLRMPDLDMRVRTALFWVGIGRGSYPEPHQAPVPGPDGDLEIVILPGIGRRATFLLLGSALRHRLGRPGAIARSLQLLHAPWVELSGRGRIPIALDGEPHLLEPPLRIRFRAGALIVATKRR
jgi:diacylglycerol kinase family enzyme